MRILFSFLFSSLSFLLLLFFLLQLHGSYGFPADVFSYGIVLCELIGRISADPDILPRSSDFGVDEAEFSTKHAATCPQPFLQVAFDCCRVDFNLRPVFSQVVSRLRGLWMKRNPEVLSPRGLTARSKSIDFSGVLG